MAGLIVYDMGTYKAKQRVGRNIYPGYVLMRKTEDIAHHKQEEGQVHGKLCRDFFDQTPTEMMRDYNAVIGGFAIKDNTVRDTSMFNWKAVRAGVQDGNREMTADESAMIKGVVAIWTRSGCSGMDITVK